MESEQRVNTVNEKDYEIKVICKSKIYAKKTTDQLIRLYYLVS